MSLTLGLLALTLTAQAAVSGSAKSSSAKVDTEDKKIKYDAKKAVDGSFALGWGEDEEGYGEGSWLELDLGRTQELSEINIWPGNLSQGQKSFREYSRPKKVKVTISGGDGVKEIEAVMLDRIQRYDIELDEPFYLESLPHSLQVRLSWRLLLHYNSPREPASLAAGAGGAGGEQDPDRQGAHP